MTTTTKEKRYNVSDYLKLEEGDTHQLIKIEAMKEQQKQIEELKKRIEELEKK